MVEGIDGHPFRMGLWRTGAVISVEASGRVAEALAYHTAGSCLFPGIRGRGHELTGQDLGPVEDNLGHRRSTRLAVVFAAEGASSHVQHPAQPGVEGSIRRDRMRRRGLAS